MPPHFFCLSHCVTALSQSTHKTIDIHSQIIATTSSATGTASIATATGSTTTTTTAASSMWWRRLIILIVAIVTVACNRSVIADLVTLCIPLESFHFQLLIILMIILFDIVAQRAWQFVQR